MKKEYRYFMDSFYPIIEKGFSVDQYKYSDKNYFYELNNKEGIKISIDQKTDMEFIDIKLSKKNGLNYDTIYEIKNGKTVLSKFEIDIKSFTSLSWKKNILDVRTNKNDDIKSRYEIASIMVLEILYKMGVDSI